MKNGKPVSINYDIFTSKRRIMEGSWKGYVARICLAEPSRGVLQECCEFIIVYQAYF